MNQKTFESILRFAAMAAALTCAGYGQTLIDLGTQSRNINFTGAQSTSPVQTGAALPAACSQGQMFLNMAAAPGQNLYVCTATDTWTPEAGAVPSGTLALMPLACSAGALYVATDQPAGQQLYTCSSANIWTQMLNLGGSGALQITDGSLDINPAVVPQLGVANTFTAFNTMTDGISLLTSNPQPACSDSTRGTLWFIDNGSSKDDLQVCVYTGSAFAWVNIY